MLKAIKRLLLRIIYFGTARTCPVCKARSRRFRSHRSRREALCPVCGAFERHRFMWLFLQKKTDLFDAVTKKLLHFAPEPVIADRIAALPDLEYISGDLDASKAMMQLDITDIDFPEAHFDCIICSHVLEHVPDDRKAMRELHRVLKPTGWVLLQVPIKGEKSFEDLTITDARERERLFGQKDHVRQYGLDFAERLESAGFRVEVIFLDQLLSPGEMKRYGLTSDRQVFFCSKFSAGQF